MTATDGGQRRAQHADHEHERQAQQRRAAAIAVGQRAGRQRAERGAEHEGRGHDAFRDGSKAEAAIGDGGAHEGQRARDDAGVVAEGERAHGGGDRDFEDEAVFLAVGWRRHGGRRGSGRHRYVSFWLVDGTVARQRVSSSSPQEHVWNTIYYISCKYFRFSFMQDTSNTFARMFVSVHNSPFNTFSCARKVALHLTACSVLPQVKPCPALGRPFQSGMVIACSTSSASLGPFQ